MSSGAQPPVPDAPRELDERMAGRYPDALREIDERIARLCDERERIEKDHDERMARLYDERERIEKAAVQVEAARSLRACVCAQGAILYRLVVNPRTTDDAISYHRTEAGARRAKDDWDKLRQDDQPTVKIVCGLHFPAEALEIALRTGGVVE